MFFLNKKTNQFFFREIFDEFLLNIYQKYLYKPEWYLWKHDPKAFAPNEYQLHFEGDPWQRSVLGYEGLQFS